MVRRLLVVLLLSGCQKCTSSTPPPMEPPAVPRTMACTEAFLEVVPIKSCDEGCAAGDAEACSVAADRYLNAISVRRDEKLAFERALKGCELGSSSACSSAASAVLREELDGGEVVQYAEFRKKAIARAVPECKAGRARACENLSFFSRESDPEGEVSNAKRALELYRKGCDGGDWFLCRRLALATEMGALGLDRDEDAARSIYKKACNLGDAHACIFAFDRNGPDEISTPLLKRGCELGDGDACFGWSIRLEGEEKTAALRKSCDNRFSLGCTDVMRALERAGDAEGAKKARQALCELDDRVECPK